MLKDKHVLTCFAEPEMQCMNWPNLFIHGNQGCSLS